MSERVKWFETLSTHAIKFIVLILIEEEMLREMMTKNTHL